MFRPKNAEILQKMKKFRGISRDDARRIYVRSVQEELL